MPTPYTPDQIAARLTDHPGWSLGDDGQLHAAFTFKNFMQAVLFLNAVAHLAEAADHHPDLCIHGWNTLDITLSTHSAGGITDKDFALIAQIAALPTPRR